MSEKIPKNGQEALYLVDGKQFLHLQKTDGGVDYTIHDAQSKIHLSGGHISDETVARAPYQSYLKSARMEAFRASGIKPRQTERINPLVAPEYYKNQILKPSWEISQSPEERTALHNAFAFDHPEQEFPKVFDARPQNARPGTDAKKEEISSRRSSVLEQLKTPEKHSTRGTPRKKAKETPSL